MICLGQQTAQEEMRKQKEPFPPPNTKWQCDITWYWFNQGFQFLKKLIKRLTYRTCLFQKADSFEVGLPEAPAWYAFWTDPFFLQTQLVLVYHCLYSCTWWQVSSFSADVPQSSYQVHKMSSASGALLHSSPNHKASDSLFWTFPSHHTECLRVLANEP